MVTCGDPTVLPMTDVSYKSVQVGSQAAYTCKEEYIYASGDDTRTCGEDGMWGGTMLFCTGMFGFVVSNTTLLLID